MLQEVFVSKTITRSTSVIIETDEPITRITPKFTAILSKFCESADLDWEDTDEDSSLIEIVDIEPVKCKVSADLVL